MNTRPLISPRHRNNAQKRDFQAIKSHAQREQAMSDRNELENDAGVGSTVKDTLEKTARGSYSKRQKQIEAEALSASICDTVENDSRRRREAEAA